MDRPVNPTSQAEPPLRSPPLSDSVGPQPGHDEPFPANQLARRPRAPLRRHNAVILTRDPPPANAQAETPKKRRMSNSTADGPEEAADDMHARHRDKRLNVEGIKPKDSLNKNVAGLHPAVIDVVIFPDLPPDAYTDDIWHKRFVPTLLACLGFRDLPWYWDDNVSVRTIQDVWNVIYGERVPWTVRAHDLVHSKVARRILHCRAVLNRGALEAFDAYFKHYPTSFPDTSARRDFCASIMESGRLFYAEARGDYMKGLFMSPFVLTPLHLYVKMMKGAVRDPTLDTGSATGWKWPHGAVGMAAAAAYQAAAMWRFGKLPEAIDDGSDTKASESHGGMVADALFQSIDFDLKAAQCAASARNLEPRHIRTVMESALHFKMGAEETPRSLHDYVEEDFSSLAN